MKFSFTFEVQPMSAGRVRGRAAQPQSGAVPAASRRRWLSMMNMRSTLCVIFAALLTGCVSYKDSIPDKNAWLNKSADILRSAIDTNQIELACSKLVAQPEIALAIRNYSRQAIADLDDAASLLTNPKLKTYGTSYGEGAEIIDPNNPAQIYYFCFLSSGQFLNLDKRNIAYTDGRQHVFMRLDFYKNGKLSRDGGGHLAFKEDGALVHCFINGKYIVIK